MVIFEQLNSPLQHFDTIDGVELWIKREDLIHPFISGNKWRKLKYYWEDFQKSNVKSILTFGGAFSNHIAAIASLGSLTKVSTHALVRGDEITTNDTLDFCREHGMALEMVPRKVYQTKDNENFLEALKMRLPNVYVIPEGGKGSLGIKGCIEILDDVPPDFTDICCAAGTATTFAGLLLSNYAAHYRMFPALKGGSFLQRDLLAYISDYQSKFSTKYQGKVSEKARISIVENYHFGGYGKVSEDLVHFMNMFYEKYQIPLDPIYTGKMMFGVLDMVKSGLFEKGSKVLCLHTGGLQGIKGMNDRLKNKNYSINYAV